MLDAKELATATAAIVKTHVAQATAPLIERLDALEKRKPEKGEKGDTGEPGQAGERGETGVGLAGALIDRDGMLVLTLSDGTTRDLGPVVGKDGADGQNGADGAPGEPGKDAEPTEDWAADLSLDEKAGLVSSMLRKELPEALIQLPEPIPYSTAPTSPSLVVHNHLPKRGVEKTTVTKHDERGRIVEYERRDI